jgi:nitrate reductase gamma subunit
MQEQLLEVLQGPAVWVSLMFFAAGLILQSIRLFRLTQKQATKTVSYTANPEPRETDARRSWIRRFAGMKVSALGASPFLSAVSIIFHICLFATPIFLMSHSILIRQAVGISVPYFSEPVSDLLTAIVLFCGLFFLLRRLLMRRVRVLTSAWDVILLLLVLLPFFTGLLARHHLVLDYRTMILIHMAAAELILILIPFTKFFHMVFFFFGRFVTIGEFSLGRPQRTWKYGKEL